MNNQIIHACLGWCKVCGCALAIYDVTMGPGNECAKCAREEEE